MPVICAVTQGLLPREVTLLFQHSAPAILLSVQVALPCDFALGWANQVADAGPSTQEGVVAKSDQTSRRDK